MYYGSCYIDDTPVWQLVTLVVAAVYQVQGRTDAFRTVVKIEVTDSRYFFTNGQGGGGGPLAAFLKSTCTSIRFLSVHIKPTG